MDNIKKKFMKIPPLKILTQEKKYGYNSHGTEIDKIKTIQRIQKLSEERSIWPKPWLILGIYNDLIENLRIKSQCSYKALVYGRVNTLQTFFFSPLVDEMVSLFILLCFLRRHL